MLEKLKEIALRYEDLQAQLGDSAIYGDSSRLASVTRELKELEPVVEEQVKSWGIQKAVGKEIFTVQGEYSANLIRERVLGQTSQVVKAAQVP